MLLYILRWHIDCSNHEELGIGRENLLLAYFLAAASILEPERSTERIAWTKTTTLIQMVVSYFNQVDTSYEQRRAFINDFHNNSARSLDDHGYMHVI